MKRRTVVLVRRPRGRPPRAMPGRPKTCPDGHPSKLILWGRREWTSAPFRRQRMRCLPLDGTKPHTFSLPRRQNTPDHPHGEDCSVCDVQPGPTQGPLSLVDFFHTGSEIARLLQLVGRGTSLRRSSLTVRIEAQKFVEDESGMRHASREHVLAARYLDLFGAEINRELAPRRWPRILVLDSKPFGLRAYGAAEHGERWEENSRAGAVLVAVGGNDPTRTPKAWRIGFAGDETAGSWLDFLNELEGDPEWVVADGSKAIRKAVRKRWPKATFYACEFHLGKALAEAALRAGIWPADPAHASLFERAFWSEADWNAAAWSRAYEGTSLSMIAEATLNSQVLESLLPDFTAKTGIDVQLEQAPYDSVVQKLTLDATTKQGGYDIVSLPYEFLGAFAEKSWITPIDDRLADTSSFGPGFDPSAIIPALWTASSVWRDKTYGMPWSPRREANRSAIMAPQQRGSPWRRGSSQKRTASPAS